MNTPSWSARCRLALASVCSLLAAAPPALAEARVIFKSERSLVLRVRDLNGDGVRDLAYFFPDQRTQFDGPGRAEIQTQDGVVLAQFRASGQLEVFALGANHPADIDDNQFLNSDDLTLLVQRAGQEGPAGIPGDVNYDGVVNEADGAMLMAALNAVDGLGWVRFDQRWPAALEPDAAERGDCPFFEGDPTFTACRPSNGGSPDGGDPDDTGPLGPNPGGGGGPGGPGPGGDECAGVGVSVTPSAPASFISIVDSRPTLLTISAGGSPSGGVVDWSVSGAVIVHSDNSRCDVEVHEAGLVVVTATYIAPNGCTAEDTLELPAYLLDLSVDTDENGTIDDADIDAEAQAPGLILLANNFDEDGDGVEGFADGFDWNPLIEQDDNDDTTTFIPITLRVGGVESGSARIRIDYPASDPMALSIGDEGWELAPGNLRLWKSDGSEPRSAELPFDGGDYIAPGEYTLADLGLFGTSEATLYVETVRESQAEGDIVIAAAVSADEESGWVASDVVVGTGVRVVLECRSFGETHFRPAATIVVSNIADANMDIPPGFSIGAWQSHRISIHGPDVWGSTIQVGGHQLALAPILGAVQTPEFHIVSPPVPVAPHAFPPGLTLEIPANDAVIEWTCDVSPNDLRADPKKKGKLRRVWLDPQTPHEIAVASAVAEAMREMEAEGWRPIDHTDPGAPGKEAHRRASLLLSQAPRWYSDVWVDTSTMQVVQIGGHMGGNSNLLGVDLIRVAPGQVISVGTNITTVIREHVSEVKTSISGNIDLRQKNKYNLVFGVNGWSIQTPLRYWDSVEGWIEHPRLGKVGKVLAIAGLASAAYNLTHAERFNDEIWALSGAIANYDLQTPRSMEAHLAALEVFGMVRTYMSHFSPNDTIPNVAFLVQFHAYMNSLHP